MPRERADRNSIALPSIRVSSVFAAIASLRVRSFTSTTETTCRKEYYFWLVLGEAHKFSVLRGTSPLIHDCRASFSLRIITLSFSLIIDTERLFGKGFIVDCGNNIDDGDQMTIWVSCNHTDAASEHTCHLFELLCERLRWNSEDCGHWIWISAAIVDLDWDISVVPVRRKPEGLSRQRKTLKPAACSCSYPYKPRVLHFATQLPSAKWLLPVRFGITIVICSRGKCLYSLMRHQVTPQNNLLCRNSRINTRRVCASWSLEVKAQGPRLRWQFRLHCCMGQVLTYICYR